MKSTITLIASFLMFATIAYSQTATSPIPTITTEMHFESYEASFGQIKEGEKASHVFTFQNTGDEPLLIISAKGSCGCTIPFFPKDPILSGEMSEIEVEFNSKNKSGKRNQKISIQANTDPAVTFLYFKGQVMPKDLSEVEDDTDEIKKRNQQNLIEQHKPSCISIFPNPASEYVQLDLKEYIGRSASIEIHNDVGQQIKAQKIDSISNASTRIEVADFTPGIYVISIKVDQVSQKIAQCFVVN